MPADKIEITSLQGGKFSSVAPTPALTVNDNRRSLFYPSLHTFGADTECIGNGTQTKEQCRDV